MAIVQGDIIDKQDIITTFHSVVKNYIASQTNWVSSTVVGNQSLATITSSTAASTVTPASVVESDLTEMIGAINTTAGHVTNILKAYMNVYSRNQTIYLTNTGNLSPSAARGTIRLTTNAGTGAERIYQAVETQVASDFNNSQSVRAVNSGTLITASTLNALITDCKNIWINRCKNVDVKRYDFYYCHSNHSNHGSHGSRGRR